MLRAKPGALLGVEDFEGSRTAIESALSRMTTRGELVRIRRGLYFKGVRSRFGPGAPPLDEVVYRVCRRGVGPAGWSAARRLGLTTQVPARAEYAVLKAPAGIPNAVFRVRSNIERVSANPTEIAVLEVLRTWPRHTEASRDDLLAKLVELRDEGAISFTKLRRIVASESSPAARDHLGSLLAELGDAA